jgi:hypothetical protein
MYSLALIIFGNPRCPTRAHSIIDANHYDFSVIVTNFGPKLRCCGQQSTCYGFPIIWLGTFELFCCICVFIPTAVLNGQVLFAIFAIGIMFPCRFHKHLVVTNKGNHLLITLCLVCSTIMVKFYEKLWLLKKITNYWHLNFLLLIAPTISKNMTINLSSI